MPRIYTKTFYDPTNFQRCNACKMPLHGTPAGQWTYSKPLKKFYHTKCFIGMMASAPKPVTQPSPAPPAQPSQSTQTQAQQTMPTYAAPISNGHDNWIKFVHTIRPIVEKTGLGIAASPRFSYAGAKYLALTNAHLTVDTAMQICDGALFEGLSESVISKLRADIKTQAQQFFGTVRPNGTYQLNAPFAISLDSYHCQTRTILTLMQAGLYPFLHGAPGAGKTHLAMQLAQETRLPFVLLPCSPDMLRSEILGTRNPLAMPGTPSYQPSAFFDAWCNGGIIMFDECGNAPGSFLNLLNSALAQNSILFPSGISQPVTKHKNCYIIFADNSNLWGDDPKYPERQDAGSAFRNRLWYVKFDYDTALETRVVSSILERKS